MNQELPEKIQNLLSSKFNILDTINFLEFDQDFAILSDRLAKCKKSSFDINDRIIIVHQDTDFYFEHCNVGVNLYNFFQVVQDVDISCYVFLFFTNHIGLSKEINLICKDPNDRPTVIESFLSTLHYCADAYVDINANVDSISHQGLLLSRTTRSHRCAIVNSLKGIDEQHLIRSITNK